MKLAITADNHLTSQEKNPERFNTFENILTQMLEMKIEHLIIAGDLFDASLRNYSEFEKVCKDSKYNQIQIYIIPGNHDEDINDKWFTAKNVHIFTQPTIHRFNQQSPTFLFLPYEANMTMGKRVAEQIENLPNGSWILIGHGDFSDRLREGNAYESGVYMPLMRKDLQTYQPLKVFLGHIHIPTNIQTVYFTGSPCGLNITEMGYRRFLVYDIETNDVDSIKVDTNIIYLDETLTILPVEDEKKYLRDKIMERISRWKIGEKDKAKVQIRLKVNGYSSNKKELMETIKSTLEGYPLYAEPDLDEVNIAIDSTRSQIAMNVQKRIENLEWVNSSSEPEINKEQILLAALKTIFER